MSLLLTIVVFCLIMWLIFYLIGMLPIPEPFGTVIRVVLILLAVVWLLERSGMLSRV